MIELAFLGKILFKDTKDIFFFIKTSFVKECSCWNAGKDKSKIQEAKEVKTLPCQRGWVETTRQWGRCGRSVESKHKHFKHQLEKTPILNTAPSKKYILIHTPEIYMCGYAYLYTTCTTQTISVLVYSTWKWKYW